jgi:hypothetical protein
MPQNLRENAMLKNDFSSAKGILLAWQGAFSGLPEKYRYDV